MGSERAHVRAAQRGSASTSRRSSACIGRAPIARPSSSSTTPPPPRTSRRRRSWPRSEPRPLRPAPAVRPWLHRIVVNRAIDWTRARQLRAESELADAAAPEPERLDGSLLGALAALPPDHRAVIVLRYLLEYTPGEIAELLGVPRGTVNSRLRRGLDAPSESPESA